MTRTRAWEPRNLRPYRERFIHGDRNTYRELDDYEFASHPRADNQRVRNKIASVVTVVVPSGYGSVGVSSNRKD